MMQHKDINGELIHIRDYAEFKQDKQRKETALHIHHLAMASRRIVDNYPDLAGWYCLRVKDRREFAVEKVLTDSDVISLVATRPPEIVVRRGRKWTIPEQPWMPGYVLTRIVPSAGAFDGLHGVKDVLSTVGGSGRPYRISDKVIDKFTKYVASLSQEKSDRQADLGEFLKGQIVKIIDGPFASFEGVIVDNVAKGADKLKCEVSIFGRSTPFELDIASVEKL